MINVPINEAALKTLAEKIEAGKYPIDALPLEVLQIIHFVFMEYFEEIKSRAITAKKSLAEAQKTVAELEKITEKRDAETEMARNAVFTVAWFAEEKK